MSDDLHTLPLASSLAAARSWLRERLPVGTRCPCCGQFAKVYRRKLNSGLAHALVAMYRAAGTGWMDTVRSPSVHSRHVGMLQYWGLVEQARERNGVWRVTELGERFARREAEVPGYAVVYDGTLIRLDGNPVLITDALGDKFDYAELMAEVGEW